MELFSATEQQTRHMLRDAALDYKEDTYAVYVHVARAIFAMYTNAFTVAKINEVADAIANWKFDREAVQKELTRLKRKKVLRTRNIRGVTYYEVNY